MSAWDWSHDSPTGISPEFCDLRQAFTSPPYTDTLPSNGKTKKETCPIHTHKLGRTTFNLKAQSLLSPCGPWTHCRVWSLRSLDGDNYSFALLWAEFLWGGSFMPVAVPGSCSNRHEVSEILTPTTLHYVRVGRFSAAVWSLALFSPGCYPQGTHCSSMWKLLLQFSASGGLQA